LRAQVSPASVSTVNFNNNSNNHRPSLLPPCCQTNFNLQPGGGLGSVALNQALAAGVRGMQHAHMYTQCRTSALRDCAIARLRDCAIAPMRDCANARLRHVRHVRHVLTVLCGVCGAWLGAPPHTPLPAGRVVGCARLGNTQHCLSNCRTQGDLLASQVTADGPMGPSIYITHLYI
jgi:hypothetical protein